MEVAINFNILFRYINNIVVVMLVFIFSLYVTCRYAPVENIHKPLSKYQKECNGKKGRTLVCVFLTIAIVMMKASSEISATILGTLFMVVVYILAGRRENAKRKNV